MAVKTPPDLDANSYATVAEATAYFDLRTDADAWGEAEPEERGRALVTAARRMDQERFVGVKATADQPLQWPRLGVALDGYRVDSDALPERLKRAQFELALAILVGDFAPADTGLEGFDSVRVGPLSVEPTKGRRAASLPATVRREISPLLASQPGQVRVVRG